MGEKEWGIASKEETQNTFKKIPNLEDSLYLAASIIIDDRINKTAQNTDRVGGSLIDEKKQESLNYFVDYMAEKSDFQVTNAPLHKEYAETALKKMLAIDEDIAVMLYNSASENERRLIKYSYENILKNINE